jgi:hypothetical protein
VANTVGLIPLTGEQLHQMMATGQLEMGEDDESQHPLSGTDPRAQVMELRARWAAVQEQTARAKNWQEYSRVFQPGALLQEHELLRLSPREHARDDIVVMFERWLTESDYDKVLVSQVAEVQSNMVGQPNFVGLFMNMGRGHMHRIVSNTAHWVEWVAPEETAL